MGDPGAVVAVVRFTPLSAFTFGEDFGVHCRILAGIKAAMPPMARAPRLWQVLISSREVGAEKRLVHGHHLAVRQTRSGWFFKVLI